MVVQCTQHTKCAINHIKWMQNVNCNVNVLFYANACAFIKKQTPAFCRHSSLFSPVYFVTTIFIWHFSHDCLPSSFSSFQTHNHTSYIFILLKLWCLFRFVWIFHEKWRVTWFSALNAKCTFRSIWLATSLPLPVLPCLLDLSSFNC